MAHVEKLRGEDVALIFAHVLSVTAKEDPGVDARVTFEYVNWKGRCAIRTVQPLRVFYGKTEHHPEPQWFVTALDAETAQQRDFACADITYPKRFTVAWEDMG